MSVFRPVLLTITFGLFSAVLSLAMFPETASAQFRPMIYEDVIVEAPVSEVWEDWTTEAGVTSFFAKAAEIEMRTGGAYRLYFAPNAPKGSRGNDTGQVLGWQTERMLNVSWAMPPYMPEIRPHLTVLQLEFVDLGADKTKVRLFHTGFGQGKAWDEGRMYFEKTWPEVLALYKKEAEK